MKIAEYFNEELFKELSLLEPAYYYGSVGTPEQARVYSSDLFNKINLVLAKYGIIFKADMYHKSRDRSKVKIELWKTNWKRVNKNTKARSDDWITIKKGKDLSSMTSEENKLNNTKDDHNPFE